MSPYSSSAQRKFFHTDSAKRAGITKKEVHEFDQASKGMKLPQHKSNGGPITDTNETLGHRIGYPGAPATAPTKLPSTQVPAEHKAHGGMIGQQAEKSLKHMMNGGITKSASYHSLADALKQKQEKERISKLYRGGSVSNPKMDTSTDKYQDKETNYYLSEINQDDERDGDLAHDVSMEQPEHYQYQDSKGYTQVPGSYAHGGEVDSDEGSTYDITPESHESEDELAEREHYAHGGNVLDANARKHIASKNFAGPDRSYPIEDASHARNALARVAQHGSEELQAKVRAKVHAKYPNIGKHMGGEAQGYAVGGQVLDMTSMNPAMKEDVSEAPKKKKHAFLDAVKKAKR